MKNWNETFYVDFETLLMVKIIMKKKSLVFHSIVFFWPFYFQNENLLISQRVSHFDKAAAKSCTCRMWNKSHRVASVVIIHHPEQRFSWGAFFYSRAPLLGDQRKEWIRKNSEWPAAPKNAKRWGKAPPVTLFFQPTLTWYLSLIASTSSHIIIRWYCSSRFFIWSLENMYSGHDFLLLLYFNFL